MTRTRTKPGQALNILALIAQGLGWRVEAHSLPFGTTADMPLPSLRRFSLQLTDEKVGALPPDIATEIPKVLTRFYFSSVDKALQRVVTPKRIEKWRTQHNLTKKQAADLIGIAAQTLKNYETGKTTPRLPQLVKVFNVLAGRPPNTPVDWPAVAAQLADGNGT